MFNDYFLIQKTRELKTGLNKGKSLMIRLRLCCVEFTVATVYLDRFPCYFTSSIELKCAKTQAK